MARLLITDNPIAGNGGGVQSITKTTPVAADDCYFVNYGNTLLIVENLDSTTRTITVPSVADPYGRTGDLSLVVPAAVAGVPGNAVAGPFPPPLWNQLGTNQVYVNLTDATAIKFATVSFTPAR